MTKGRAYVNLYARLESKEGKRSYTDWLGRERQSRKDVQQVRVIKDENGNVMVNSEAVKEMEGVL